MCCAICLASLLRNYLPRWTIVCVLFCSLWEISLNKSRSHLESQKWLEPSGGEEGRATVPIQTWAKAFHTHTNIAGGVLIWEKTNVGSVPGVGAQFLQLLREPEPGEGLGCCGGTAEDRMEQGCAGMARAGWELQGWGSTKELSLHCPFWGLMELACWSWWELLFYRQKVSSHHWIN